jgi:hypothetical protein
MKFVVFVVMAIGSIAEAKPTAPVEVHIDARAVAGGFDVTLVATPTRDVPSLELHVGTKRVTVGATRAGQVRTLSAHVTVAAGAGSDVVGSATVPVGRGIRNAVAFTRVGAQAPLEPRRSETVRTLPDGTKILEVR